MKKTKMAPIFLIVLLATAFFLPLIPLNVQAATRETETFRPMYQGMTRGTKGPYVIPPLGTYMLPGVLDREINLEAWDVYEMDFTMTWALPNVFIKTAEAYGLGFVNFSDPLTAVFAFPAIKLCISTDKGATYAYNLSYASADVRASEALPGDFTGFKMNYPIAAEYFSLFGPDTRIMIELTAMLLPFVYTVVNYIAGSQLPVPPYDFIGGSSEFCQYDAFFTVEYSQQEITYVGELDNSFENLPETLEKLTLAGDAILNTMHPSGASNELTNKVFGTDSFIVIYSSQIAFIELLKLRSVIEDPDYLPAVKRFIVWMWSKQNITDGSFPFILTDGDQHYWQNVTEGLYYGRDKIDSFSACAISLMKAYYNATADMDIITRFWPNILACKDFVWNLIDPVYGIPVDGVHYTSETEFYNSTWNWLHDSCEAYQGFKDYAWLEGARGNTTEQTYFDAWAESIAANIRIYFWNESIYRYAGMFDVSAGSQDVTFVYNIITPLIYGIETNATRSILTLNQYVNWGILTGRYLNKNWAVDYAVSNEYSTMSGMIYCAYAQLITQFSYAPDNWMKLSYVEVTKFLFNNPVYTGGTPAGNLQDPEAGILDWVDLENYIWAPEYARLIETSAWLINGWLRTPDMGQLFRYSSEDRAVINATIEAGDLYWEEVLANFTADTGYPDYTTDVNYAAWVEWLKAEGLWVQWFDFQFFKNLYLSGAFGGSDEWRDELEDVKDDLDDHTDDLEDVTDDQDDNLDDLEDLLPIEEGDLPDLEELLDRISGNYTLQLEILQEIREDLDRAKMLIYGNATAAIKAQFDEYFNELQAAILWIEVRIAQVQADIVYINSLIDLDTPPVETIDALTTTLLSDSRLIEEAKHDLIDALRVFTAWLETIIGVPWWEVVPEPPEPWIPGDAATVFIVGAVAFWAFLGGSVICPISLAGAIKKRNTRLLMIAVVAFMVALISFFILVYGG